MHWEWWAVAKRKAWHWPLSKTVPNRTQTQSNGDCCMDLILLYVARGQGLVFSFIFPSCLPPSVCLWWRRRFRKQHPQEPHLKKLSHPYTEQTAPPPSGWNITLYKEQKLLERPCLSSRLSVYLPVCPSVSLVSFRLRDRITFVNIVYIHTE